MIKFKDFSKFYKSDIRSKLRILSSKLNIDLYPSFFKNNLYSKIIFHLIFLEKIFYFRKKHYNQIFKTKINYNNLKLIAGTPRSGNNFLNCILRSYTEILEGGNGIPKYNFTFDRWQYSFDNKQSPNLYNSINFKDNNPTFEYLMASNHPLSIDDLIDYKKVKPIILIRNPIDATISWYWFVLNFKHKELNISYDEININLLNDLKKKIIYAFNYWDKFIKNKKIKEDYLIIKYEEMLKQKKENLINILNFFKYEIDLNILEKAISINTKEKHNEYIGKNVSNLRFTNVDRKIFNYKIKDMIVDDLKNHINSHFNYKL